MSRLGNRDVISGLNRGPPPRPPNIGLEGERGNRASLNQMAIVTSHESEMAWVAEGSPMGGSTD